MGNGGSHAQQAAVVPSTVSRHQPPHWHHSLPSDPVLKASHLKVLPDLDSNPRLRSTNNGAILHSGGTISGRRPLSLALPHDRDPMHNHNAVHRSKSINQDPYEGEQRGQQKFSYLSNQRDPLHRSHTHLHSEEPEESFASQSKRFGSEPDLRSSQEIQNKNKVSKNMKKKYKAPPPPQYQDNNGGSSPDSWKIQQSYDHPAPQPPSRKLRLFKTRAETKKNIKHQHDVKSNGYIHHTQEHLRPYEIDENRQYPNDIFEQSRFIEREKLIRSPSREREEYLKYPSNREDDMVQTQSSLKREENILQTAFSRQEFIRTKNSQQNMYREKSKAIESRFESNRGFRNSERFKKQDTDNFVMRREKSFDTSLIQESSQAMNGVNRMHNDRKTLLETQHKFNNRDDPLVEERKRERSLEKSAISNRKSAPAGGLPNPIGSSDFQAELKMATRKLRNVNKPIASKETKIEKKIVSSKVDSGLKEKSSQENVASKQISRVEERNIRNSNVTTNGQKNATNQNKSNIVTLDRSKQGKPKAPRIVREDKKEDIKAGVKAIGTKVLPVIDKVTKENIRNRRESRVLADRGQASGKESTPEQSPSRVKTETSWDRNQQNQPCKSFYFGMDKSLLPAAEEEVNVHEKVRRHLEMNYKEFSKTNNAYPAEDKVISNTPKDDYNTKLELPQGSSESALSSEPEQDDPMSAENNPHGIALQLRPTLPKKQLEIPRFSPAAAWRLLAAMEAENESGTGSEVITPRPDLTPAPHHEEERIRRLSRPRPARSTHDKSGDSGISGDAGPGNDDCIEAAIGQSSAIITHEESSNRPLLTAWTPQQDLEEESSSDAGVDSPHSANIENAPAKYSARQQVFSLSLPRETHLAHLGEKNKQFQQPFNSLQKFKKSVSGALGVALGNKKLETDIEETSDEQADNNWFLSRSAPNSLNNGINSNLKLSAAKSNDSGQQQTPPSSDQEDDRLPPVLPNIMRQQPPFSYLATGGHVMYLPQYDSQRTNAPAHGQGLSLPLHDQPYSMSYAEGGKDKDRLHHHHHRQYHDDIMERRSDGEIEEIDPAEKEKYKGFRDGRMMMSRSKSSGEIITSSRALTTKPRAKGKRFTFQSTVRQIERRRLAEKLSREAESKERQRLSELEAMRRVEEEFQRKRAREKASIRQQLRLVSLDESCSSLPSSWGQQGRAEPEGAVSPSPPPVSGSASGSGSGSGSAASGGRASNSSLEGAPRAPATRVLSEYRQATREYRDYRRAPQAPTIHPPACYNMPRAPTSSNRTGGGGGSSGGWAMTSDAANDSDNYRKEFARGRRAPSSSGSDLSQGGRGRLVTPPRSSENYLNDDLHEKFSSSLPRRDRGTIPLFQ